MLLVVEFCRSREMVVVPELWTSGKRSSTLTTLPTVQLRKPSAPMRPLARSGSAILSKPSAQQVLSRCCTGTLERKITYECLCFFFFIVNVHRPNIKGTCDNIESIYKLSRSRKILANPPNFQSILHDI
ncbi:hypothetical protein E2C01_088085 [Portunus trituberculatus]|uniref:Uncharacterized protein n=1 Tax=Portunus trituberculatus TaxID=210409 RepID=A0A5B7J895_PORTR|nr:hypothetical protein [Portunus trituberculatus]